MLQYTRRQDPVRVPAPPVPARSVLGSAPEQGAPPLQQGKHFAPFTLHPSPPQRSAITSRTPGGHRGLSSRLPPASPRSPPDPSLPLLPLTAPPGGCGLGIYRSAARRGGGGAAAAAPPRRPQRPPGPGGRHLAQGQGWGRCCGKGPWPSALLLLLLLLLFLLPFRCRRRGAAPRRAAGASAGAGEGGGGGGGLGREGSAARRSSVPPSPGTSRSGRGREGGTGQEPGGPR